MLLLLLMLVMLVMLLLLVVARHLHIFGHPIRRARWRRLVQPGHNFV